MASRQTTGMRGVYLVAAELSKRGFIALPTSRGAQGADLLVTDEKCQRVFTVQVKTDTTGGTFWLVGKKVKETVSRSHVYVLVRIFNKKDMELVEYHVVRSKKLSELAYLDGNFPNIKREKVAPYKDKWDVFGKP